MGITVTGYPNGNPPYFQISIAPANNATITTVTLTRTVNGATVPTRVQPSTGPSPRIVYDYEADWDTGVIYNVTVNGETYTSTPVTISPTIAWMIHPTVPALSCQLDARDSNSAGIVSIGTVTNPTTTTAHDIIGSEYRLVTRSGPRNASRTQIVYATVTETERTRFRAMVRDQTPILFREPAAFGWLFDDGYYDIGDITEERFSPYGPERRRNFTIPIERVNIPAGNQQSIRTWADVVAQNASWSAVTAAYATWTDVLTNTRS